MCATFTLLGALVVGCIDNSVDPSIVKMREAKAELDKAKALLEASRVEYVKADAAYRLAEAEVRKADADFIKADAERIRIQNKMRELENELKAITNQFDKDSLQIVLEGLKKDMELEKAELDVLIQHQLTNLWAAKQATAAAEFAYKQSLLDLEKQLMANEITRTNEYALQLIDVMNHIRLCIDAIDTQRTALYELQADEYFYRNVDVTQIKAKLEYKVGKTERDLYYVGLVKEAWENVMQYADGERKQVLPDLVAGIEQAEKDKVQIQAQLVKEQQIKDDLDAAYTAANKAYMNNGTRVSVSGVLNGGTDYFSQSTYTPVDGAATTYHAQVLNGTFGFYNLPANVANNESNPTLGTNQVVSRYHLSSRLPAVINQIKRDRLFQGVEGIQQAADILAARESTKNTTAKAYQDSVGMWKSYYASGVQADLSNARRANWVTAKANYEAMLGAYQLAYEQTLNPLYKELQKGIARYVELVKLIVAGNAGWDAEINQISDVLGGIGFDPTKLAELVFGANFPIIKQVYTAIMAIPELIAIVEVFNAALPTFYTLAAGYQGAAYQEPIMQKYNNGVFDYHAWFLLYMLFENNQLNMGDILIFNQEKYADAVAKLSEDFLGFGTVNYPGSYMYHFSSTTAAAPRALAGGVPASITRTTAGGRTTAVNVITNGYMVDEGILALRGNNDVSRWAILPQLFAAERALHAAWIQWGLVAGKLTTVDRKLFSGPNAGDPIKYGRTWAINTSTYNITSSNATRITVPGYSDYRFVPTYVKDNPASARVTGTASTPFYFRPELSDGVHPSLELGVDVDWGILSGGTLNPADEWGVGYNAIFAYRTALVDVDWSSWTGMGLPVYNEYPVLWQNHIVGGKGTWDNNSGTDYNALPLFGKALVAARNHQLFKFWYDNQASYEQLIIDLEAARVSNAAALAELAAARTAALNARNAQADVILALNDEWTALGTLITRLQNIINSVNGEYAGIETAYKLHYDNYYEAVEAHDYAKANLALYNSAGTHFDDLGVFVDAVLEDIAAQKLVVLNRIEELNIRMAMWEAQKTSLLLHLGVSL